MAQYGKIAAVLAVVMTTAFCAPALAQAVNAEPPPARADAGEAANAARVAERSLGLQTELPSDKKHRIKPERPPGEGPQLSVEAARIMLWGAVIVALAVLVLSLKGSLWSNSRSRRLKHEEELIAPEATAARMEKAHGQAEDIARTGGFAEAMHLLLLQSVMELRRRLDISIAASLTSREILHRIALSPKGRAAFEDIINRVEISYFGSHEPGEDEYAACRRSFEVLTEALQQAARQYGATGDAS